MEDDGRAAAREHLTDGRTDSTRGARHQCSRRIHRGKRTRSARLARLEHCFYESGHMVYAKDATLRQLHDNVADFIRRSGRSAQ